MKRQKDGQNDLLKVIPTLFLQERKAFLRAVGFRFPIEERPFCSIFQNYFCWFLVMSKADLFILLLKPIFTFFTVTYLNPLCLKGWNLDQTPQVVIRCEFSHLLVCSWIHLFTHLFNQLEPAAQTQFP